jgi:hypothetical protein
VSSSLPVRASHPSVCLRWIGRCGGWRETSTDGVEVHARPGLRTLTRTKEAPHGGLAPGNFSFIPPGSAPLGHPPSPTVLLDLTPTPAHRFQPTPTLELKSHSLENYLAFCVIAHRIHSLLFFPLRTGATERTATTAATTPSTRGAPPEDQCSAFSPNLGETGKTEPSWRSRPTRRHQRIPRNPRGHVTRPSSGWRALGPRSIVAIQRTLAHAAPSTIVLAVGRAISIAQSRRHTYAPIISDGAKPAESATGSQTARTPRPHLDQVQEPASSPIRNAHQLREPRPSR